MSRKLYDKESTLVKRRALKTNQTEAEALLWSKLRNRQFLGLKFRRQYGIGEYIADFYCPEIRLVIELDGGQHLTADGLEYDRVRTEYLNCLGIKVIRFGNPEVLNNLNGVLTALSKQSQVARKEYEPAQINQ